MIKWSFNFNCRTVRFKDLCFSHLSEFFGWSSGVTSPFTLSFITYFGLSLITYLSVIHHIFGPFEDILGSHIFSRIFLSSSTCVTSSFTLSCIHFFRINSTCITPRYLSSLPPVLPWKLHVWQRPGCQRVYLMWALLFRANVDHLVSICRRGSHVLVTWAMGSCPCDVGTLVPGKRWSSCFYLPTRIPRPSALL